MKTAPDATTRRQVRERLGIAPEDFVLLSPAPQTPPFSEGHRMVLWAEGLLTLIAEGRQVFALLPVGGSAEPRVRFFAEKATVDNRHVLPRNDLSLQEAAAAADVAVFAGNEPADLAGLQAALTAGLPVVASDAAIEQDLPYARRFPVGDRRHLGSVLLDLMDRPELRAQLASEARKADNPTRSLVWPRRS
ncbi:MAG: glycosyltransferase [Phycisphaerae bacterium]